MPIILFFIFTCKLKICIILKATIKHLDSFTRCKWDFLASWWPAVEIYGHMYLSKIMFLLPSKRKHTVLHSLSEDWICFLLHVGVPWNRVNVFQADSVWNGSSWLNSMVQTISANIHREICTRLIRLVSYSVPLSLFSRHNQDLLIEVYVSPP